MTRRKRDHVAAQRSVEKLFNEPFTPQWMTEQDQIEEQRFLDMVTTGVDQQWRQVAEESRQRIADKYPSRIRLKQFDRTDDI